MKRIRIRPAGFDARPDRPSSLRAQARRNYTLAAAADDLLRASATPRPYRAPDALQLRATTAEARVAGDRVAGEMRAQTEQPLASLTPLTLQVKELYESSAVPVRDIARLAGVHERTLYRYVQKYQWRRRYDVPGVKPKPKPKPPRKPSRFSAQPRGTGGRYVARDGAAVPARHGLKALDPAGAARAAAACARAKTLSDAASARARRLREKLANLRTLILLLRAERDLAAVAAAQKAHASGRAAAAVAEATRREELRRTLAAKLDALAAAEAGAAPAQTAQSPSAPAARAEPLAPAAPARRAPAPPSPRIRTL